VNRDDDNPPRDQPDASGTGARGGGRNGGDDGDDDRRDHDRRHRHHRYYHQDDTQLYRTSGGGTRTQSGGRTQRNRLQDECDRGYEDGLRAGEKDARRGLSSDPQRWGLYRSGGETLSRAGRPADAKQAYRDCFLDGYEEAFRNIKLNPGGASPNN
jgi:hypothetical protein